MDRIMRFDLNSITQHVSVLKINKNIKALTFIKWLIKSNCGCKSDITAENINNIDLTLASRCFLNDLVDNDPGFG